MKLECVNGPLDGRLMDAKLGIKWPYVIAYDESKMMVGYYEMNNEVKYEWTGELEELERHG